MFSCGYVENVYVPFFFFYNKDKSHIMIDISLRNSSYTRLIAHHNQEGKKTLLLHEEVWKVRRTFLVQTAKPRIEQRRGGKIKPNSFNSLNPFKFGLVIDPSKFDQPTQLPPLVLNYELWLPFWCMHIKAIGAKNNGFHACDPCC